MANHKSAKKRNRQTIKRTLINKIQSSENRTLIKVIRTAISEKNKAKAQELLLKAQSSFSKLAQKGVIKANTAARKTSRLASQVKSL